MAYYWSGAHCNERQKYNTRKLGQRDMKICSTIAALVAAIVAFANPAVAEENLAKFIEGLKAVHVPIAGGAATSITLGQVSYSNRISTRRFNLFATLSGVSIASLVSPTPSCRV